MSWQDRTAGYTEQVQRFRKEQTAMLHDMMQDLYRWAMEAKTLEEHITRLEQICAIQKAGYEPLTPLKVQLPEAARLEIGRMKQEGMSDEEIQVALWKMLKNPANKGHE